MNIIITGASKGIGYELVKKLIINPAHKIIAVSRNKPELDRLTEECKALSKSPLITLVADLSFDTDIERITFEIQHHMPVVDILVNNAGALVNKPFEVLNMSDLRKVYEVNVFAPFLLTQQLLPSLKKSSLAHIVNISSMGGVQGTAKFPGLSAYSSSKGAMCVLTECLAEEFKGTKIKVNCLALGAVQTEMLEDAFPGFKAPLKANEMADFIANFIVTGHHFFNGKIIPVSLSTP